MKNTTRAILVFFAIIASFTISGCGGGGGGSQIAGVVSSTVPAAPVVAVIAPQAESSGNSYSLTEDTYGLQNATFMSAAKSDVSFILRTALANSMTDPDFTTLFRIDITQPVRISGPGTYSIGGNDTNSPKFPGEILFFNGHKSTLLNTTSGTITFTAFGTKTGDMISGNFNVQIEDQNSSLAPRPLYTVKGNFSFVLDGNGPLVAAPSPLPAAAEGFYNSKCASCHALGSYDPTGTAAPDLALKGGEITARFTADMPGHSNITLSANELHDLKIFLNAK